MNIEYTPEAVRQLSKLDRKIARQITSYMEEVGKLQVPVPGEKL